MTQAQLILLLTALNHDPSGWLSPLPPKDSAAATPIRGSCLRAHTRIRTHARIHTCRRVGDATQPTWAPEL